MNEFQLRWHVHPTVDALTEAVAGGIAAEAQRRITAAGRFVIVLAGGTTPRPIYARLARLDLQWSRWHVYFSDERCLPAGHPERNDSMARAGWLDSVPIPAKQIHSIPAERGPEPGAAAYSSQLEGLGPFDLSLLGLGEDGHTASLFPGDAMALRPAARDALPVRAAPKPPGSRVTLSAARLSRSGAVYLLAAGEEKRNALARLRDGEALPIRSVRPENGIDLHLDEAASPISATN